MTRAQVAALARHALLIIVTAAVTALLPHLQGGGLEAMTGSDWRHVGDAVLAALIVGLGLASGTPLVQAYGVGAKVALPARLAEQSLTAPAIPTNTMTSWADPA